MSTAVPIHGLRLVGDNDYEPVSEDSRAIEQTWAEQRNFLSRTASDWLPTIDAALTGIQSDCRNADWDGDGANPVPDLTIDLAATIVTTLFKLLPKGTPAPDLIPEHDGEICISWSVDATRMFSVSVGDHGKINFAGQFGSKGGVHAWQPIDATSSSAIEEFLADVVRYVSRLFAPASVRRAA